MIPSVLARQLSRGYADYLAATFPAANEPFASAFERLARPGGGLQLEPFTTLYLPFRIAEAPVQRFEAVRPAFTPWAHQERAFERLCGEDARSTIVATGTGSGKTECFLYPILDFCYRHRGEPGIKALLIYPMNALATDQAARIARLIGENERLRGNVAAGLYIGGIDEGGGHATMGEDHIITNREAMIAHPPDILLTNYKMLDYLLVRPHDARIWDRNTPNTLRFCVVDEMHTFDGAQGTDLACLLRRLKSRLYMAPGALCCVGTSATMGGAGAEDGMRAFAGDVFGERFEPDAVIGEERLSAAEFLAGREPEHLEVPDEAALDALDAAALENDEERYLALAAAAFFPGLFGADVMDMGARLELGRLLPGCRLFQDVLRAAEGGAFRASELMERLRVRYPELSACPRPGRAVDALCALVSHARRGTVARPQPFLAVQCQLWARELARVVASVDAKDLRLEPAVNLNREALARRLPLVNCRDCGHTAWVGATTPDLHLRTGELAEFYRAYFGADGEPWAAWPRAADGPGAAPGVARALSARLCPSCLKLVLEDTALPAADGSGAAPDAPCPDCGEPTLPVWIAGLESSPRTRSRSRGARQYACPCCGSHQGLSLVGMRATTEAEVALTQLFASDFDDDHKVLVFSDSVQDASHRAGFFNGRTWKFGLRGAMCEFLRDGGEGLSLEDFGPGLFSYWRARLGEEEFIARFTPPNNAWMRAYEAVLAGEAPRHDKDYRALMEHIAKRMAYEVLLEFGLRSQTGRTLEKSAQATVAFDGAAVREAAGVAGEILANEEGLIAAIGDLEAAVLSFLDALRLRGAFAAPVFDEFLEEHARPYFLSNSRLKWMPGQHASGLPSFLLCSPEPRQGFDTAAAPAYSALAARLLAACGALPLEVAPSAVVDALRRGCERAGLVVRLRPDTREACVGINRAAVRVTGAVARLECDRCHARPVRALANAAGWDGAGCPRAGCAGALHACSDQAPDYYGALFARGLVPRVQAREHTGLLGRGERERVERRFKAEGADARASDPNVLSCTPTLEMGIDIGSLSTLVLCGMPLGRAQFVQRVGRAGRRDGNALAVVLADASARGMYYYDAPMEMLAGELSAPRVYLQASAVLERQFMAFCLDCWVRAGGAAVRVPQTMRACLNNIGKPEPDPAVFPFNFLGYVKTYTERCLGIFIALFPAELSQDSGAAYELRVFAHIGADGKSPFYLRFYDAFRQRLELRASYERQFRETAQMLDELRAHPADPMYEEQIKEAMAEQRAIRDVIGSINRQSVYGFLSNEGLLPNYAFPEEGVRLRTVLRRRRDDDATGRGEGRRSWERSTAEYGRPAGPALSEFAPGNTFYANAHSFRIDQIDLSGASTEVWRLCPNCSHAEQELADTPTKACPRCGSLAWADADQRRTMLRLSTVVSNVDYEQSLTDDASVDRTREYFSDQLLVEVDPAEIVCATKVQGPGIDFGYEYDKRAIIRQINFGERGDALGHEVSIAGDKRARTGFKVCTCCGKVALRDAGSGTVQLKHAYTCQVRRGLKEESEAVEECLFLYRELTTEAVRILIPETSFVSEEKSIRESFIAAVMLGMREKFGNVDHLAATVSDEPVADSGYRKRYLVIYDTVPGGTGYLKQLSSSYSEFKDVLRRSLDALNACACNDEPGRDGCYRCLYAFRQARDIGSISREQAKLVLGALLDEKNEVESARGLDEVAPNHLFDSELEQRFVEALSTLRGVDGSCATCRKEMVRNKPGYLLKLGDLSWEVELQVDFTPADGVSVACRPDFVFWPVEGGGRPVAVFTDGFAFHKDRLADDTLKREALRRSGRFWVWTLSWQDVEGALEGAGAEPCPLLSLGEIPSAALYGAALEGQGGSRGLDPGKLGAFGLLGWYLAHARASEAFSTQARAYSLGLLAPGQGAGTDGPHDEAPAAAEALLGPLASAAPACEFAYTWEPGLARAVRVRAGSRRQDVERNRGTYVLAELDDSAVEAEGKAFQASWSAFWAFWNVMQFFGGFRGATTLGLAEGVYDVLPGTLDALWEGAAGDYSSLAASDWAEALELAVEEAQPLCRRLSALGAPAPDEIGLELDGGEMAELAWTGPRCCFITSARAEDAAAFQAAGWTPIAADAPDEVLLGQLKG